MAERPQTITLDQLISTSTASVARTWEQQKLGPKLKVPPKIWVGIWIDFENLGSRFGSGTDVGNG